MNLELISFKLCPFVQRSVITLLYKQAPYRIRYIDLANPPPWFLKLSPAKKVPVLVVDDKHIVFESAIINEFVDDVTSGSLHPQEPLLRALNRSWIEFGSSCLMDMLQMTLVEGENGFQDIVRKHHDKLAQVEAVLNTGPFFNGDAFSLVDAAYAPLFMRLQLLGQYATVLRKDGLPKMGAWSATLLALPAVIDSAVPDFAELYEKLVRRRQGYLSTLLSDEPLNASTRRRY